jgi:hypothetical protein
MKLLRCLPLIAMVCMLSGIAKADPIDYHIVIVDPPPPPPGSFSTTPITTLTPPPVISFSNCVAGEIPGTVDPYEGCASFENSTSSALTNLELIFPNNGVLNSQTANCDGDPGTVSGTSVDFFQEASCNIVGGNYVLDFYDGSIPVGALFTIAEDGVPADCFPDGTLTTTPEPSSIWLMSTGALLLGAFFCSQRRNGVGSMGL